MGPRRCDTCHSLPRPMTPQDPGVLLRSSDDGRVTWCLGCLCKLIERLPTDELLVRSTSSDQGDEPVRVRVVPTDCVHGVPVSEPCFGCEIMRWAVDA